MATVSSLQDNFKKRFAMRLRQCLPLLWRKEEEKKKVYTHAHVYTHRHTSGITLQ